MHESSGHVMYTSCPYDSPLSRLEPEPNAKTKLKHLKQGIQQLNNWNKIVNPAPSGHDRWHHVETLTWPWQVMETRTNFQMSLNHVATPCPNKGSTNWQCRGPDQWKSRPSWCKDMPHYVKSWWQHPEIHQVASGKKKSIKWQLTKMKQFPRVPTSITPQASAQQPPHQTVNPTHNKSKETHTDQLKEWMNPRPKPPNSMAHDPSCNWKLMCCVVLKCQLKIANWKNGCSEPNGRALLTTGN